MAEENTAKKGGSKSRFIGLAILIIVIVAGVYYAQNRDDKKTDASEGPQLGQSQEEQLAAIHELIGSGEVDKDYSYAAGLVTGQQLLGSIAGSPEVAEFDAEEFAQAITDTLTNQDTRLSNEEAGELLQKRAEEQQAAQEALAAANKTASEAFVADYEGQDGVQKTELGTLYKVLEEGNGDPVGDQAAAVLYTGKLIDGAVFDSTEANGGQPVPFTAAGLIPGVGDALRDMQVGSKWEIVVPVELGYGLQAPPIIGPNQALVFEIEVVGIQKQEATPVAEEAAAEESPADNEEAVDEEN